MRSKLFLSLALLSSTGASAATLLLPDEAPSAASSTLEHHDAPSFGLHFGVAAGAGALSAPLSLLVAQALGNLQIYLIPTAVAALIPMGLLAPALTALTSWLFGNWRLTEADGRFGFWAGFAAAALVHIAALVVAGFANLSLANVPGMVLFSLLDGLAMGGTTVGTMRLFRKRAEPTAMLPSFVPTVGPTAVVPLSTVSF